ncbi:methyltransferase [Streptomyces sp. NA04227]|uniref:methyltransferase n=1 Tax=Streptomyces sp. NA04227 TaxID=2742136 RepID=UPI001592305C|nr:methyltransferase [Streptomyces sp. NA04227]QKW06338.1 methyltransferase [Streptomyces sp. NA04227]
MSAPTQTGPAEGGFDAAGEEAGRKWLSQIMIAPAASRAVHAAVKLGLVDAIGGGARTVADIAGDLNTDPEATRRLLRALAALGLFTENEPDLFATTVQGALLSTGRPDSMSEFVRMYSDPVMTQAWDTLDESVRSGKRSFDAMFGTDFFSYLAKEPELSARFNATMAGFTYTVAQLLPGSFDFGKYSCLVDIGGGDGTLLAGVLSQHPSLRGVVYDSERGLAQTAQTFEYAGIADRASAVVGDFFSSAPEGGDLYLMKNVLHDWTDEQCVQILRNIRSVIPSNGRLLLADPVLPALSGPQSPANLYLTDLQMLLLLDGKERTEQDLTELFRAAGFADPTFTPLGQPEFALTLVEAAPAG